MISSFKMFLKHEMNEDNLFKSIDKEIPTKVNSKMWPNITLHELLIGLRVHDLIIPPYKKLNILENML